MGFAQHQIYHRMQQFERPRKAVIPDNSAILLILGGDSLMVGYGAASQIQNVPASYLVDNPKLQYLYGIDNSYSFHAMSCPFYNNYPLEYGYYTYSMEFSLGNALSGYYQGTTIYIVKYAAGGTTLSQISQTPYNYNEILQQANYAISYIQNTLGKTPIYPVAFFSLANNDSGNIDIANAYAANLDSFYSILKSGLSSPNLILGIGSIGSNSVAVYKDIINNSMNNFALQDPNHRFVINTDNCEMYADKIHLTGLGYDQYGINVFNKIKSYF